MAAAAGAASWQVQCRQEVERRDLGVEGLGVLQILEPRLVDKVSEEFDSRPFGRIVALVVRALIRVGGFPCGPYQQAWFRWQYCHRTALGGWGI